MEPQPKKFATSFGNVSSIESSGNDPRFVFLHGLEGSKELFLPLFEHPSIKNHSIWAPDLLGFGESSKPLNFDYSIASLAQLTQDLLISSGSKEVILIGHSLGAIIATKLLKSKKLNIRALISMEGNLTLDDCGISRDIVSINEKEFIQSY